MINSVICDKIDMGLVPRPIVLNVGLFRLQCGMSVFEPYSLIMCIVLFMLSFEKLSAFYHFIQG